MRRSPKEAVAHLVEARNGRAHADAAALLAADAHYWDCVRGEVDGREQVVAALEPPPESLLTIETLAGDATHVVAEILVDHGEANPARVTEVYAVGEDGQIFMCRVYFDPSRTQLNERTVRTLVAAFNRNDLDAVLDQFAPDAVLYEPYVEEPIAGTSMLRDFHQALFDAFPDEKLTIEQLISTGDWVVARTVASGTQTGAFLDIPPTGRRFSVPECLVYELGANARVRNQWTYADSGEIARQLGYGFASKAEVV